MEKMDETDLLSNLKTLEEDASNFTWGKLGSERERSLKEYFRLPYGNEEEGWSTIVTSDVQDTVEWLLPALLKIFTSTEKAVSFDPTRQEDVEGAEQATDACNYVFYKQNNGFLVLYTAIKDALLVKNCAVMWRNEVKRVKTVTPVTRASHEMLAMLMSDQDGDERGETGKESAPKIEAGSFETVMIPDPMTGQPVPTELFSGRISKIEEKTSTLVEAFPPEDLLVKRDWTSPLLDKCPYVARIMRVTLSDIHEMGYTDVTSEDLAGSEDAAISADATFRTNRTGIADEAFSSANSAQRKTDDESMTEGYLRIEFVLIDFDGDGIAERRCIYRLKDKILKNEECEQVPIATGSPILVQHRWDGMSIAECVSDLQQLRTELTRQMLNGAYLANNPRTKVLTDSNWSPLANVDDLLDSRPGAILRQKQDGAIQEHVTPWVGGQMFPMLEYIDNMREQRTGVSRASQGMDANVLRNDRTAVEVTQTAAAAAARIELIGRILAETLVKPIFRGILKLLTEGPMEPISFKLRDKFVQYNPQEWRDSYEMTINVGLGTGNKQEQGAMLQAIFQQQGAIGASPLGGLLVKPKNVYHTLSKIVENAGFKNIGDFYTDPGDAPTPQPGPPPEIAIAQANMQGQMQIEQMKLQATGQGDQQKAQMQGELRMAELQHEAQLKELDRQHEAQLEQVRAQMQAQVDVNRDRSQADQNTMKMQQDAQLEALKHQYDDARHDREMAFNKWKVEFEGAVKIEAANIASAAKLNDAATATASKEVAAAAGPDVNTTVLAEALNGFGEAIKTMNKPKKLTRDPITGKASGIE